MKKLIVSLALVVTGLAVADPPLIPEINGVAIGGLFDKYDFHFGPGRVTRCEGHKDDLAIHTCYLSGAVVTISRAGVTQTIPIDHVLSIASSDFPGIIDYTYIGSWSGNYGSETSVAMELRSDSRTPNTFRGSFSLQRYGISYGIEATNAKPDYLP